MWEDAEYTGAMLPSPNAKRGQRPHQWISALDTDNDEALGSVRPKELGVG